VTCEHGCDTDTFEVIAVHNPPGTYTVMHFHNGSRVGGDKHWLSRNVAERAMRHYQKYPHRHGKATEKEILRG